MAWTLTHRGTHYAVVAGPAIRESILLVDGEEVDRSTAAYWESAALRHGEVTLEVRWGPRNRVTTCTLTDGSGAPLPLVPPAGSSAARREAFARDHPVQFVLRRVGVAAAQIVIGVLGVSALVSAFVGSLLPRIDLSWIPRPHLPDIDPPDWLRHLDPFRWLARIPWPDWPDVSLPGWLDAILASTKYWVPLVVAALIALNELDKRRKRDAGHATQETDDDPVEGDDPA